jgi:hypothetical protein
MHNEIRLLIVLNKQNVVMDIFLKEAHLYDKIRNDFDIFFQKTQNEKSLLEMNKMLI